MNLICNLQLGKFACKSNCCEDNAIIHFAQLFKLPQSPLIKQKAIIPKRAQLAPVPLVFLVSISSLTSSKI